MPQIDDSSEASKADFVIDRRRLMVKGSALAMTGAAMAGLSTTAFAAASDNTGICTIRAPFAIRGGTIVHGFMAAPSQGGATDIVVVIGESGRSDDVAQAVARRYAHAGYFAMAPDLHATFGGIGKADPAALRAEMQELTPMLAHLPRSNGNVRFVSA